MTPKRKTQLPYDGYVRVSRVGGRGGASFISPDVQRETIARLAAFHGLEVGEVVEEIDVSGGKDIEARELGRLIRKVEDGESGGLLVWKVSRFSRNLLDGVMAADRVRQAGGSIIGEDLDSTAPMGRAILGFLLGWAEEERDARRTGWHEAQARAAARGVHPTRTPVGYTRDAEGRLAPDPAAGPAVAEIFRMRASGASLQECADVLAKATGKGWGRSSVRQLFTSQTYLGRIAIGDSIYQEDAHPALVDERTWHLAQREGRRPTHDGSLASQGVLAGLIRCAGCGHVLTVTASGPPGARVASYTCRRVRASGVCPAPASATVAKVDAAVLPGIDERPSPHTGFDQYLATVDESAGAFEEAVQELDTFLEAGLVSELGPDLYRREVARRRQAVEEARSRWEADHAQGATLVRAGDATGLDYQRARARQAIEAVTLAKADPKRGRWQPIEERLEVEWRK
jgi:DNA invertase Pin-like site-specific DNA recombinase